MKMVMALEFGNAGVYVKNVITFSDVVVADGAFPALCSLKFHLFYDFSAFLTGLLF